jgi:hypothetical protein
MLFGGNTAHLARHVAASGVGGARQVSAYLTRQTAQTAIDSPSLQVVPLGVASGPNQQYICMIY